MANIRGIKSNNEYIISATQLLTAQLTAQFALSCRLMHSCSAMDRHMQHAVFHTIAFLAFSCLAFSTLAFWCRRFMSRIFHPCNMVPHFHVPQFHVSHFSVPKSGRPIYENNGMHFHVKHCPKRWTFATARRSSERVVNLARQRWTLSVIK